MGTTLASLVTNKRRVSALKSLGIVTVGDALTYYPFRVTEPVPLRAIREAAPGQQMAFAAVIRDMRVVPMNARRGYRLEATVDDADFARSRRVPGSTARLTFFSYRKSYVDWVSVRLRAGTSVVVSGMPGEYMGQLQFTHPEILTVAPGSAGAGAGLEGYARGAASGNGAFAGSADPYASAQSAYPPAATAPSGAALKYDADTVQEALTRVCRPRPVYHASSRISSEHIHETILGLLWMMGARTSSTPDGQLAGAGAAGIVAPATDTIAVQNGEEKSGTTAESGAEALSQSIPDVLPESVRKAKNLMHRAEAFLAIHDPASTARFKEAIETLRYEEAFVSQVSLLKARSHAHKSAAHSCPLVTDSLRDQFIASLPFSLTAGQQQVIHDIAADLAHDWPMQRLLQGEVGSGKTVVALAAMLQAVDAGYQAVLVAPTQVLAEQHAETIGRMVEQLKPAIPVTLLTGGMKLAARRKALAAAASGEPGIIVATHAAFSKTFQAPHLALVVIDEQHRFGVEQRESLNAKTDDGTTPHLLVMTATPIPRTLAMTLYGDLDVSVIDELPPGRQPIRTVHYTDAARLRLFGFMRQEIKKGRQIYVVYPLIKESETMDYKDLQDGYEAISRDFPLPEYVTTICHGKMKPEDKEESMRQFKSGEANIMVATSVIEVGVDVPNATVMVIESAERFGLSQLHQLRGRVGRGSQQSYCILMSGEKLSKEARLRLEAMCETNDGFRLAELDLKLRGAGDVNGTLQSGMAFDLKIANPTLDSQILTVTREAAAEVLTADPTLTQNGHEGLRELRKRYSGREEIDFSQIS